MKVTICGLLMAVAVALFISPFASKSPDGLEKIAGDKGFLEKGEGEPVLNSPLPDYSIPAVKNEGISTALAGVLGTIITFGAALGIGKLVKKRNTTG